MDIVSLFSYGAKKITIVHCKGADMSGFDRDVLKEILEGELYRRFIYQNMKKDKLVSEYGFQINEDETKYKAYILFEGVLFILHGNLNKTESQYQVSSISIDFLKFKEQVKKDKEPKNNSSFTQEWIEDSDQPPAKAEKQVEKKVKVPTETKERMKKDSNKSDFFLNEENLKKIRPSIIKVWLRLMSQKDKLLKMNRKDFSVMTYSRFADTNAEDREYPVIYEFDKKFRVVFPKGKTEDFYTEFCAKIYAVLAPSEQEVQIIQEIRILDQEENAKDKINEFLTLLVSESGEEYFDMIKALRLTGEKNLFKNGELNTMQEQSQENVLQSIGNIKMLRSDEGEE